MKMTIKRKVWCIIMRMINCKKQEKDVVYEKADLIVCKLIFFYGVMQCARFVFQTINYFFMKKHVWNSWVNLLIDVLFLFYFFRIYTQKKILKEQKYLTGILTWGMIESILPFVLFLIRMLIFFCFADKSLNAAPILEQCKIAIQLVLVCYVTGFCGIIFEQKWMLLMAIIWLGMLLILYALEKDLILLGIYPLIYIMLAILLYNVIKKSASVGLQEA